MHYEVIKMQLRKEWAEFVESVREESRKFSATGVINELDSQEIKEAKKQYMNFQNEVDELIIAIRNIVGYSVKAAEEATPQTPDSNPQSS